MVEKRSEISHRILHQINKALENLGGSIELLCIVGSYGDTQEDEDILEMLEQYNSQGTTIAETIVSVHDTPKSRRERFKVAEAT